MINRRKDTVQHQLPFYDQVLKPGSYSEVKLFSFGDHQDSSSSITQHTILLDDMLQPAQNKTSVSFGSKVSTVIGGWSSAADEIIADGDEDDNNPFAFAPYSEYLSDDSSAASPYQSPVYADDFQQVDQLPPYITMRYAIQNVPTSDLVEVVDDSNSQTSKKRKRKRTESRDEPEIKRRKKVSRNFPKSSSDQTDCCIKNCSNSVTNRLRFSLRCTQPEDYKNIYLDKGWNKVCHHHYFSDLYKYKKNKK